MTCRWPSVQAIRGISVHQPRAPTVSFQLNSTGWRSFERTPFFGQLVAGRAKSEDEQRDNLATLKNTNRHRYW
jgi:hypothetical protein